MKKRFAIILSALLAAAALCSCTRASEQVVLFDTVRGTQAPAAVVLPSGDGPFPLVVLCHGFNGSREQGIGFSAIAASLAQNGIASVRIDFPGCGDSTEDSSVNSLSAMKDDVHAAVAYAAAHYPVDTSRIGILGYSLGGRLALELLAEEPGTFCAAALLAPAADTEDLKGILGGPDNWALLEAEASSAAEGYAVVAVNGTDSLHLSAEWFSDLSVYPNAASAERAAASFDGPVLVLYSPDDSVIAPSVSQYAADCLGASVQLTPDSGHDFGFYNSRSRTLRLVCKSVGSFFADVFGV